MEMGSSSNTAKWGKLNESQVKVYKELIYKLFLYKTFTLRGSNDELRCPFCYLYEEEEELNFSHYTLLLLHAIQVADMATGKQRADHSAMARYLSIDLADYVNAEAQQLSRKRPRPDEDITKMGSSSNAECDELNETELDDYKEVIYKLFQYKTYTLRDSNGDSTKPEMELVHRIRELERELEEMKDEMNNLMKIELEEVKDELQWINGELIKAFDDVRNLVRKRVLPL